MKRCLAVLLCLSVALATGCKKSDTAPDAPVTDKKQADSGTATGDPKTTVENFVKAINASDTQALADSVLNAKTDDTVLKTVMAEKDKAKAVITVQNIAIEMKGDDKATATVESTVGENGKEPKKMTDKLDLQKAGGQWKIVAPDKSALGRNDALLGAMAYLCSGADVSEMMSEARESARTVFCMSNEKQIATGMLMYSQDYDEQYPAQGIVYSDALFPYTKNREIFKCPSKPELPVAYSLNSQLVGKSQAMVAAPAFAVMLYEGNNSQLEYRHQNKSNVAFADGHVKRIAPESVKEILFDPTANPPSSSSTMPPGPSGAPK